MAQFIDALIAHPATIYVVLGVIVVLVGLVVFAVVKFSNELRNFFADMFSESTKVSSKRFISVVGAILIICTACILSIYCASKNQGLPGGSAELLGGMLLFLVTGYTANTIFASKSPVDNKSQVTTSSVVRTDETKVTG